MTKLMALDYGSKRVGIASTNETGEYALPRAVWPNDKHLITKIIEFKAENNIEKVIIGESKNLKQQANKIQHQILGLKEELEKEGIEVVLHPEIYTSLEAERLQGRHELIDASAAALILKSYIDSGL
jgi:RNase H-fold protein (predicted Holliday junction resolvase)